jgi:hypothetical protein
MPIEDGLKQAAAAFNKGNRDGEFDWGAAIGDLSSLAIARARGTEFGNTACGTTYGPGKQEIDVWHLALLLGEYTAGLLAQKSAEGHCLRPGHVPCQQMASLHMDMFIAFKKALESLIAEMRDLEKRVRAKTENLANPSRAAAKEVGLRDD